jgi:hypothetical protein
MLKNDVRVDERKCYEDRIASLEAAAREVLQSTKTWCEFDEPCFIALEAALQGCQSPVGEREGK